MNAKCEIVAHRSNDGHVVRIVGRGTARESASFREFAKACLGYIDNRLVIDVTDCVYLDSTFLGCILSLYKQARGPSAGKLQIAGPADRRQSLFSTIGIAQLFEYIDQPPISLGDAQTIPITDGDAITLGRHILECHQALARVDGPNQRLFASVVERLSQELRAMDA